MFTGLLAAVLLLGCSQEVKAEPVQYSIEVESSTDVSVTLEGDDEIIKPGQVYESENLTEPITVTFIIRYMDDEIIKFKFVKATFEPGKKYKLKIRVFGPVATIVTV